MPFPLTYLPGTVIETNVDPEEGFSIRSLSFNELEKLSEIVGGGDLSSRTPDPQARRFEFKRFLLNDLNKFDAGEPLDNLQALNQFQALTEGLIYGHLSLKIYDLRACNFNVPSHLRYLGVLTDHQGRVFGGTDPDTLFFSSAYSADYDDLNHNNSRTRPIGDGAKQLLLALKQNMEAKDLWDSNHILWMRVLDLLFFRNFNLPARRIDLYQLRSGWRQIGPITLQTSVAAGEEQYSNYYLPVYEEGYLNKALVALSGDVTPVENALQLTVKNTPAGKIAFPSPSNVAGADSILLGAGNLNVEAVPEQIPIRVNYEQLTPKIQNILGMLRASPRALQLASEESPFSFPDVIRIPIQHDGFIALEGFNGRTGTAFSQRFLEKMRGTGRLRPLSLPTDKTPPCLIQNPNDRFFVDDRNGSHIYYVETFGGQQIEELQLLGYVLWNIFDNQAEILTDHNLVRIGGKRALFYIGERFEIDNELQCEWPNPRARAATLQRFKGLLEIPGLEPLFVEAAKHWLDLGFRDPIVPLRTPHQPIRIGPYSWFTNSF